MKILKLLSFTENAQPSSVFRPAWKGLRCVLAKFRITLLDMSTWRKFCAFKNAPAVERPVEESGTRICQV